MPAAKRSGSKRAASPKKGGNKAASSPAAGNSPRPLVHFPKTGVSCTVGCRPKQPKQRAPNTWALTVKQAADEYKKQGHRVNFATDLKKGGVIYERARQLQSNAAIKQMSRSASPKRAPSPAAKRGTSASPRRKTAASSPKPKPTPKRSTSASPRVRKPASPVSTATAKRRRSPSPSAASSPKKRVKPAAATSQPRTLVFSAEDVGKRESMEDFSDYRVVAPSADDPYSFFAVYDGHGGKHTASMLARDFASHHVVDVLRKQPASVWQNEKSLRQVLANEFVAVDNAFRKTQASRGAQDTSGSTATVVVHCRDRNALVFAHVGDSRAVLIDMTTRRLVHETVDHHPTAPQEAQRLDKSQVNWYFGKQRVCTPGPGQPGLLVSRAFGDFVCKGKTPAQMKKGLWNEPDVRLVHLQPNHDYLLVVASDGFWEMLPHSAAFVHQPHVEALPVADQPSLDALCQKWFHRSLQSTTDNVTLITAAFVGRSTP